MRFCGNCGTRLGATGVLDSASAVEPGDLSALPEQVGVMMGADLLERFRKAGLEAAGQRRNVTLLFADISGFTNLSQRLDYEELYVLVQQFDTLMARSIYKFEGMVDKFIGDGIMAIFGAPIAQENSAEMAIRAALDMQAQMAVFNGEFQERYPNVDLRLHIGLHCGTVIVGSMGSSLMMNYTAIGDTVNLAARLQQNADAGTILVSQSVYQFTRPLFDFEPLAPLSLKGYASPVPAFRLVGLRVSPGSLRGVEGLSAPLIGREHELRRLRAQADRLVEFRQGQYALVEGEAGIGKSRLTAELRSYLKSLPVRVLVGQSYTYRRMVAYWIFQDMLRALFGLQQNTPEPLAVTTVKDHLTRLLGIEAAESLPYIDIMLGIGLDRPEVVERTRFLDAAQLRQRIFMAVRQVLAAESRLTPLVLIFEDLHWADETSLELLTFLVDSVFEAPFMCLGISRQFDEENLARLAQKAERNLGERCLHLRLVQLNSEDSEKLLAELLALPELPASLHEQIIVRSAGNPFYLEETLRMLIDARKIEFKDGHWRLTDGAAVENLGVPETLQGLILARFDRLEPALRRVLQVSAVIGRNFSSSVLVDVLRQEDFDLAPLPANLNELEQRGFIMPQAGLSDFDYLFKHVLVSDAIYSTLLKAERSDLHGQVGEAIEHMYPDRTAQLVELLARHYSYSPRSDRALHYLILAGQQEARSYANHQARQSFTQAIEILGRIDHQPRQEIDAHAGLGDVLVFTGEYPAAVLHYQAALAALDCIDRSQSCSERGHLLRKLSTAYERQGNYDQAMTSLADARAALEELPGGDAVEQAWIENDTGWIHLRRGSLEPAEECLQRALALVEGTSTYDLIASIYNRLGGLAYQKGTLDEATVYVGRSLELRQRIGDVTAAARSYNNLGLLNWRMGNWNIALENFKRGVELHGSLGDVEGSIDINSNLGLVYLEQGDFTNAQRSFNQALSAAQQIGHSYHVGLSYLHLARYYLYQQDWSQALTYYQLSQQVFDEIGVTEHRIYLEIYAGSAWLGLGNLEKASSCTQNALVLLSRTGNLGPSEERAYSLRLWAQVQHGEGAQLENVADTLRQSMAMFDTIGNQAERARSQVILTGILRDMGDTATASELLKDARQVFEQLGAHTDLERL
jgi:class 3 adenylate cyclase/tetratricopeptide (TPR) repeat protein